MKKILLWIVLGMILISFIGFTIFSHHQSSTSNDTSYQKITLAEVAHTVFYAPMYAAIEKGYFEEEGIQIELVLTSGADKVTAALLSGDAQIGFCGSEATIYVYNGGEKDYLKTFSQLTQKDGTFLVSREDIKDFTLDDLKGKSIIGGRAAGMPEMTLEYALKQNGINPRSDVFIDTSIAFPAMSGAFIGGQGDFVTLFEPTATMVEKQGYGYVVASIGEIGGVVPYTSYSAKSSYIEKNPNIIISFNKAIQKGLDYVHSHTDIEIAKTILKQFPDTSLNDLQSAIHRYRMNDTWPKTTNFTRESFDHLQDIMIDYGELDKKVDYDKLIYSISKET